MHNCKNLQKAASHASRRRRGAPPSPNAGRLGPREALKRHEAEHDAAHAKEAAGDVAQHLAEAVETRRGTVAAIKKTGVDMYGDKKAIDAVKDLQAATRRYLAAKYGQADSYTLDLQLKFPESMGGDRDVQSPFKQHLSVDAARRARLSGCCNHEEGRDVALRLPSERRTCFTSFSEGSHVLEASRSRNMMHNSPHERLTLGFAGRPGGPEFYISTVDNVRNHGPGSQGSKTEADSCFAKVVSGADVVEADAETTSTKRLRFREQQGRLYSGGGRPVEAAGVSRARCCYSADKASRR